MRQFPLTKRIYTLVLLLLLVSPVKLYAGGKDGELEAIIIHIDSMKKYDSTVFWKFEGRTRLNINTIVLSYWSDGGESSLTGAGSIDLSANYLKEKIKFENNFQSVLGVQVFQYSKTKKTEDKLNFSSILGLQFSEKWYYSFNTNFSTQYIQGFAYPNDSVVVSDFLAPGYLNMSLGIEYKPSKYLSLYASPLAGKITFVQNQNLANEGKYGVTPALVDTLGNILVPGKTHKSEFGFSIIAKYKGKINKSIDLNTKLMLYNNYLDPEIANRWNVDVDWETWLDMAINKFLVANIYVRTIYDHNIKVPVFDVINGQRTKVGETVHLQTKQNFGMGLAFKF